MASSSASPISKSKYDVFISFQGQDTRRSIVSHLYKALDSRGIATFKDDTILQRGNNVDEILRTIEDANFVVVVLSKNYATSKWCLRELQLIMELYMERRLGVIPIFYGVEPSAVRHQTGCFDLRRYQDDPQMADKVPRWREALKLIASISGVVSELCTDETTMVEKVISSLSNEKPVDKQIDENKYDATVLHEAARHEYEEYVTKIIGLYPSLVSSVNVDGDTPLHFAARTGNTSILVKMLESGEAACTKINKQGETAFIIACVNNHVDAAIILVEEATSMTMVELDAAFSAHHPAIPDKILEKFPGLGLDVDEHQSTLLHKACKVGNLEMVRRLLEVAQSTVEIKNKDGLTPLHYAAMNGSVEILKEFLNRTPSSFNVTTQGTMETVFHLAAKQKHIKAFTFMAESANIGKLLYEMDADDNTVLHVAASVNSTSLVRYILKETAIDVTLKNKKGSAAVDLLDKNGKDFGQLSWILMSPVILDKLPYNLDAEDNTVLHVATRHEYEEYVTKIIELYPSLVSSVNVDGDTPLHFAARTGNTRILVRMLESGEAACKKINKQGETAFIIACVNNHIHAAIILMEEATSMTMVELYAAFSAHHPAILDKILEKFPGIVFDVDEQKSTLLHKACKVGNLEMVRKLFDVDHQGIAAEKVNKSGLTPLHCAAMTGSVDILKEFLKWTPLSFNVTTQGTMETVFHLAIKHKNTKAFIFMAQSANIGKLLYKLDAEDNTVLHVAARHEDEEYLTKIIELCPSLVSSVNKQGETAFILACINNHVDAAIRLIEETNIMTMVELYAAFSAHQPESLEAIPDKILEKFPGLVTDVDEQKSTLLHKACLERNLEIVKTLFDVDHQGIAAEKKNKNGLTPLHCAAMTGSVDILKEFLKWTPSSFNVTTQGTMETVFHLAAKQKHIEAFNFMAKSANIGKLLYDLDAEDNTVLHVSASVNSKDLVRYILLETTIDATLKNKKGSAAVDLLDKNGKDFGQLSDWLRQDEEKIQRPFRFVKFADEAGEHNRNTNNGELLNSESFDRNLVRDQSLIRRKNKEREMHTESLQNVRNTITIVAVLIASVAFTCGINPPGGVHQDGDLIGKATAGKKLAFKIFSIANNIALFTSLSIVTLLVSIISYRTSSLKMYVVIAHKMMWLAVASMVTSYAAAAWITVPHSKGSKWLIYTTAAIATVPLASMFVYVTFMMVKHILKKQSLRRNTSHRHPPSTTLEIEAAGDTGYYGC